MMCILYVRSIDVTNAITCNSANSLKSLSTSALQTLNKNDNVSKWQMLVPLFHFKHPNLELKFGLH